MHVGFSQALSAMIQYFSLTTNHRYLTRSRALKLGLICFFFHLEQCFSLTNFSSIPPNHPNSSRIPPSEHALVMHRSPPKWCTQEVLEECYRRQSNAEDWRCHEVHRAIRCGALQTVCPERPGVLWAISCPEATLVHRCGAELNPMCSGLYWEKGHGLQRH